MFNTEDTCAAVRGVPGDAGVRSECKQTARTTQSTREKDARHLRQAHARFRTRTPTGHIPTMYRELTGNTSGGTPVDNGFYDRYTVVNGRVVVVVSIDSSTRAERFGQPGARPPDRRHPPASRHDPRSSSGGPVTVPGLGGRRSPGRRGRRRARCWCRTRPVARGRRSGARTIGPISSGVPCTQNVSTISSVISALIVAQSPVFESRLSSGCRSPQPCTSRTTLYAGVEP